MGEIAALLFTDIVDSTLTTQRLGDERAAALWTEHDRRARDLLRRHHGREIDRADGFLLLFDSRRRCGALSRSTITPRWPNSGITARVGLHVGPSCCARRRPTTSRWARSRSRSKASPSRSPRA